MSLPYIQFYAADWLADTRALSLESKGAWMDIICVLHRSQNRGTSSFPIAGWARLIGATIEQTNAVIDELLTMQIADIINESNANVTVTCRRMLRESITREQTRQRVHNHRIKNSHKSNNDNCNNGSNSIGNSDGNSNLTPKKLEAKKLEANTPIVPKEWKPSPFQARLGAIFGRRITTTWGDKEIKAWKAINSNDPMFEEDLKLIERYHSMKINSSKDIRRHDLGTLLNNWSTEIDRARNTVPSQTIIKFEPKPPSPDEIAGECLLSAVKSRDTTKSLELSKNASTGTLRYVNNVLSVDERNWLGHLGKDAANENNI